MFTISMHKSSTFHIVFHQYTAVLYLFTPITIFSIFISCSYYLIGKFSQTMPTLKFELVLNKKCKLYTSKYGSMLQQSSNFTTTYKKELYIITILMKNLTHAEEYSSGVIRFVSRNEHSWGSWYKSSNLNKWKALLFDGTYLELTAWNRAHVSALGSFNAINGKRSSTQPFPLSYFPSGPRDFRWNVKIDSKSESTDTLSSSSFPSFAEIRQCKLHTKFENSSTPLMDFI